MPLCHRSDRPHLGEAETRTSGRLDSKVRAAAIVLAWGGLSVVAPPLAAQVLTINGNYTNATTLSAGTGLPQTTIAINNGIFTQTGSGVLAAVDGGLVTLNNVSVVGGLLTTSGNGVIRASNGSTNSLTGVTLAGWLDLASASTMRVAGGLTFGTGGTISIDNGSLLAVNAGQTLGGTGTIVFGAGANNRLTSEGAGGFTVGPNLTIRGHSGTIGQQLFAGGGGAIQNQGTIVADVAGGTIQLTGVGVTNSGAGTLGAANGGVLLLNGTTLSGGRIVTGTGGLFRASTNGNNFVNGVTLAGTADLASATSVLRVGSSGLAFDAGTMNIDNGSLLAVNGGETIGGTGTIVFGATGNNRITTEGTGVVTIGSNVTIRGANGTVGASQVFAGGPASIANAGTIAADVTGGTIRVSRLVTNTGTIGAANGGVLLLDAGTIDGGALATSGGGVIRASTNGSNFLLGTSTLNGTIDLATTPGLLRLGNGGTGGITLAGGSSVALDTGSILGIQGQQTLGGSGAVVFGTAGTVTGGRITLEGTGTRLIVGPNASIRGANGILGGGQVFVGGGNNAIVNNGTIVADVAGGTLQIAALVQNAGTVGATGGGILLLNGGTIDGGTLATSGGGAIRATAGGSNFLLGTPTLNGTIDLATGPGLLRLGNGGTGGLTLAGSSSIALDNGGILGIQGQQTLDGTGAVVFGAAGAGSRITLEGSNSVLTIGPNVTIRGTTGTLGGVQVFVGGGNNSIVNNGTIVADVAGGTITVTGLPLTNNATISASTGATLAITSTAMTNGGILTAGGGTLTITSSPITNTGTLTSAGGTVTISGGGQGVANSGTLSADGGTVTIAASTPVTNSGTLTTRDGGTLFLRSSVTNASSGAQLLAGNAGVIAQEGVTISGGTIATTGSGVLRPTNTSANFIQGVTLAGTVDLASATSTLRVTGGLTFGTGGTISIDNGSLLAINTGQTIGGTGTIVFGAGANNRLTSEGSGTFTIGPNVTIRGQNGTIGQQLFAGGGTAITNQGTIVADVAGGTIRLTGVGVTNSGAGTVGAANGGVLLLDGTTLSGGRIVTGTGGLFRASNNSSNFVAGVTLAGTADLASATSVLRVGTGGLALDAGTVNIDNSSLLAVNAGQAITGTGEIVFGTAGGIGNNRITIEGTGAATIGPNVTIRGGGGIVGGAQVFAGGNAWIANAGTIIAELPSAPLRVGTLVTNSGTVGATGGGVLLLDGGTISGGSLATSSGGLIRATSGSNNYLLGTPTLTGTIDLATTAGSVLRLGNGGTGGLTLTTGSAVNLDNNGLLAVQGQQTLSGSGALVFGTAGASTGGRISLEGTGTRLIIDPTASIRGANGTVGASQVFFGGGLNAVQNDGTIVADAAGGPLRISTVVTNAGTVGASGNGVLLIDGGTISGGALVTSGAGVIRAAGGANNYLIGTPTLTGTIDLATSTGAALRLGNNAGAGGLTFTSGSVVNFDNGNLLATQGQQTLGGTGTVVFGAAAGGGRITLEGSGTVLTIGPNVTVRGINGTIGASQVFFGGGNNAIVNDGTIVSDGGGTITVGGGALTNNGLLRAQNGTLTLQTPLSGTGTLQVDATGVVNLTSNQPVTQGILAIGAPGATLNNGTQSITLSTDYTNASAGSGNAFNRRAGLTGTGQVLAGGNVTQVLTGAQVTNGATTNATLTVGNVRVGTTTFDYNVANGGTVGPALRGAIQTAVNGGNITDARLSGSGVTPGLYGPAAPGASAGPYSVTFTTAAAGALAPLAGQVVNLRSSYENIVDQKLNVVLGSGAGAYQVAQGQLNTPALNFGTVQVGQTVSQTLSFTNAATGPAGYVEDLNVAFGASSGVGAARITGIGSITGLAAGATASGPTVHVNTTMAGTVNGGIALTYTSAGTVNGVSNGLGTLAVGGTIYGVSGTITGVIVDQAVPVINNPTINLGNVRINAASPTANVSVTNQATGNIQAALSASITGNPPVTGSGSFALLAPGATNATGLSVGINTSTAGAVSGTATVSFVSDASNIGNCVPTCQLALPPQEVAVNGAVYRLANPTVAPPAVTLAARVGTPAPTQAIAITNASPDQFTEALNASFSGAAPAGFTTSGSVTGLAAQGTSNALTVGLNTTTAGSYTGTATIAAVSTGAGTTGAPDIAVGSPSVALTGRVYTTAVGQVAPNPLAFGIVHVGDVATRTIAVTNAAPVTALNDVLTGIASGGNAAFGVFGNLGAGVAAGTTDNTSLTVRLNTATNGQFTGTANVALASHNADLADLSLGTTSVGLTAQVNNYAQGGFAKTGGAGAFSMQGTNSYLLDFGTLTLGAGPQSASLGVDNLATGFADLLNGSFITNGFGFTFTGFAPFTNLAAGNRLGGFQITFDAAMTGMFSGLVTLNDYGTNASGYNGVLNPVFLNVRGNLVAVNAVPEPGTWALLATGLAGLGGVARRRRRDTKA